MFYTPQYMKMSLFSNYSESVMKEELTSNAYNEYVYITL